eukprot:9339186-Pyramimonas_sp.AAC.1
MGLAPDGTPPRRPTRAPTDRPPAGEEARVRNTSSKRNTVIWSRVTRYPCSCPAKRISACAEHARAHSTPHHTQHTPPRLSVLARLLVCAATASPSQDGT